MILAEVIDLAPTTSRRQAKTREEPGHPPRVAGLFADLAVASPEGALTWQLRHPRER